VGGTRHALVDEAEDVAEPQALGGRRVHAEADLVGDDAQVGGRVDQSVRQSTTTVSAPASAFDTAGTRLRGASTVVQWRERSPRWRAMRAAMSASPASAVATKVTRPRRGRSARASRLLPLRAPPSMRSDDAIVPGSSREDRS
jgi:hypothetical protein